MIECRRIRPGTGHILVLGIFLLGCNWNHGSVNAAEILPSRSECIVGLSFVNKTGVSEVDFESELREVTPEFAGKLNAVVKKDAVVVSPSMNMQWEQTTLYLQFSGKCQNKIRYTETALSQFQSELIDYKFIIGPIKPGINTIEARGPFWRD